MILDIIVTHYDEPWEVGKPFFDMIEHQACVDPASFSVTLVQDGEEHALDPSVFADYHYPVDIFTIPHAGTAAARNAGIEHTSSGWIMFCDFDDRFADVCSLRMILDQFPNDDCDIVWAKYVRQQRWANGTLYVNKVDSSNLSNTDAKIYNRRFLDEHDLRFNPDFPIYYDYVFDSIAIAETVPWRFAMLTTDFYTYLKVYRTPSLTHRKPDARWIESTWRTRDEYIANELLRRGKEYLSKRTIAKAVFGQYYAVYDPDEENPMGDSITPEFLRFYAKYRDVFRSLSESDLDAIKDEAETEILNEVQNYYNDYNKEFYFVNETTLFRDWIAQVEQRLSDAEQSEPVKPGNLIVIPNKPTAADINKPETKPADGHEPRVIVYCGTYDTYVNMLASAKSVLCTTPVDKIYFLIEDDVFPFDIPDVIECINVKNQTFFPPSGPNFDSAWTYMCLMRAAFPQMFPQYNRILSFDIDIVVKEDISALWDIDISDAYLAGVTEPQRQKTSADPIYINFGVVMMNLDKLRRDNKGTEIIEALNHTKFGCPEQDAFNKFCAGHIVPLPNDYNVTVYSHITGEAPHERILHYAGLKYWRHFAQVKQFSEREWPDIMKTQNELRKRRWN